MQSAKEMFEDMSYELTCDDVDTLEYTIDETREEFVVFHKSLATYAVGDDLFEVFPKLHQAIHQQLKELGWI